MIQIIGGGFFGFLYHHFSWLSDAGSGLVVNNTILAVILD